MFATLTSLILSAYLFMFTDNNSFLMKSETINNAMLIGGGALLLGTIYIFVSSFNPLLKAEKKLTPLIMTLFKEDKFLFFMIAYLSIFSLISFGFSVIDLKNTDFVFPIWLTLFGIGIDLVYLLIKRIYAYIDPYQIVEMFTQKGKQDIRNEKEIDLYNCVEGLSEIALKSIHHHSSSLGSHIVDELEQLTKNFLDSAKSLSHHEIDEDTKKLGISDKINFTLFFLFQRIEQIFNKALDNDNDPLCINIIEIMGKIVIHAAKYDLTITSYPLHYIQKFINQSIKKEKGHVLEMSSCVLQETARLLMEEIDFTYLEIKDTYVKIINTLDLIAKELFREDKNISFSVLELPFENLKNLFAQEKIMHHPDTPAIVQNINRVVSEFETLKTILQTMPKIPPQPGTKE